MFLKPLLSNFQKITCIILVNLFGLYSFSHQLCATGTLLFRKEIYPRKYNANLTQLIFFKLLKNKKMSKFSTRFLVLAVLFVVCLITSNFFVPRVWQIGHTSLQLPGAVILFPVSYIINDCLTEVYGYRKSRLVIWIAFAMSAFVALMSTLVCLLPEPIEQGSKEVARVFNSLFFMAPRTTISSLLAFVFGSNFNAFIMSKMKVGTKGKGFALRAILSSVGGEFLDSCIFFPIALGGIVSPHLIPSMMLTQVCAKTLYEIIILPVTASFVKYLKKKEGVDVYDEGISYNPFKIKDI